MTISVGGLVRLGFACPALNSATAPAEQQVKDHDEQDEADSAPSVITDPGTHVVATAADQKQNNNENKD